MPKPPRYKQIVDRFVEDIRSGRLKAGTRLPTHRELAAREGLGIVTVKVGHAGEVEDVTVTA